MPPVYEDKKYCVRTNCPFKNDITIEAFKNGRRENTLIMSLHQAAQYIQILNSNGYERVEISETDAFERP